MSKAITFSVSQPSLLCENNNEDNVGSVDSSK